MPKFPFLSSKAGMVQRVREFDWSATPLGDVDTWPPELKAIVGQVLESRFPAAIVWGPALTTIYNDAFLPILGAKTNTLGESFHTIWKEAWSELQPMVETAFSGEAVFIENFPLVIDRYGQPEQTYFTFCYSPLRMADGSIGGIMDTVIETTETVNAHAQRELLSTELTHRLKNVIAVVQAIARQTLKSASDREVVDAFDRRLSALGAAQDVLTKERWAGASMKSIMNATLGAVSDRKRFDFAGCDVELGPKSVLALSMLLHELATNAEKYGALSNDEGRVRLECEVEDAALVLTWKERGGPAVQKPSRRGFGSRIIDMGLGGPVVCDFQPEGLTVRVQAPLFDLQRF